MNQSEVSAWCYWSTVSPEEFLAPVWQQHLNVEAGDVTKGKSLPLRCINHDGITWEAGYKQTDWNKVWNRLIMISLLKTQINTDIRIFMFSANSKKQSLIVKKPCAIIDYIWRIEFIIVKHYVNIKMLFTTLQYPDKVNHHPGWMCQRPETHP